MTGLSSETLHVTCVAIDGRGVLLAGRSGSGKSDLALRLIDRGAALVSDDYTLLRRQGPELFASAAPNIAGQMEVRGVGVIPFPHVEGVPVALLVTLDEPAARLPEPATRCIAGVDVPVIALPGLEASAPIKVELALRNGVRVS